MLNLVSHCAELKIPKMDVTEHLKKVDKEFDPLLKSAAELESFSQRRAKEIQDEIKQIDVEIVSHTFPLLHLQHSVRAENMQIHSQNVAPPPHFSASLIRRRILQPFCHPSIWPFARIS